jgi:L-rhamnose-H+ transport protein
MKVMRKYRFEHWWFVSMLVGLVLLPWAATFALCPNAIEGYQHIERSLILKANLFSFGWGIANVLCGLCFVRIGFALTGGILTGLGVSIGVTVPLVIKGSGLFSQAPNISSPAGHTILVGVALMLCGVFLVSLAGFGRDKALKTSSRPAGDFAVGLAMVIAAGILSVGLSFSFVYSQDSVIQAMKVQGAGEIAANFAVWAISLIAGALVNLLYPAYLMTKNRSWSVLTQSWRDGMLSALIGLSMCLAIALMGKGMLLLGTLGASVGFGIQQSSQMLGNQAVGFISGEWKGVLGSPRIQMYLAILLLLSAAAVLAYGNTLAKA